MNYLDARMQRFNKIRGINQMPQQTPINQMPQQTPINQISQIPQVPNMPKFTKESKYEIADDRDEIIIDIIRQKPKIADLRKALKKYAKLSIEEHYEDILN